ncbi:MAG: hypothetical protein IMW97_08585 [Firmicutes bacterium]|nr:hypothetical protein [Candidatus Fermentithermobacillaceae bacterium]
MARLRKKRQGNSVVAYYCACMGLCDCPCFCSCSCPDDELTWGLVDRGFVNNSDSTRNYRDENYSPLRDYEHAAHAS